MKMTEKKEIKRLFDAGDFESRKEAIAMLYEGFSDYYLMVIKRELILNKYDVYSPEEVLSDVFLGLISKKTNLFLHGILQLHSDGQEPGVT